eukprot:1018829-Amphidinium_carterae.1
MLVRRCHHGVIPVEQPFSDTNQTRQVSERLPCNAESTWGAEWIYKESGPRSSFSSTGGVWPGFGLGWPAPCRPHLKQYGTMCGLSSPGLQSWRNSRLTNCKPSLRSCATKRRLVVNLPYCAWAMELTQRLEAGKTSICLWRSGRPTASSANSCLRWTGKRPGCPALTEF